MASDQTKDWRKLCEAAAKEQDPQKLWALVTELNKALDERDRRRNGILREEENQTPGSSAAQSAPYRASTGWGRPGTQIETGMSEPEGLWP